MNQQSIITNESGRLDIVLSNQTGIARSEAKKAIEASLVTVDGKRVKKPSEKVQENQKIQYSLVTAAESVISPVDLQLEVLYEDNDCLVINKPRGIAVHPGSGMDKNETTILHGIAYYFQEHSIPFTADACLVHRLDKGTTGCMLIAKTKAVHEALQLQFQERTVQKFYHALVTGVPQNVKALIDSPIDRDKVDRTKYQVSGGATARSAQTTYKTLWDNDKVALLECELHTGRTHQIRVHLHAIGHPIVGDVKYTSDKNKEVSKQLNAPEFCLHAQKLIFNNMEGRQTSVEAKYDNNFNNLLQKIQKGN
jgi:23S rRNA pseudouridine1911/1915/1917 synthase